MNREPLDAHRELGKIEGRNQRLKNHAYLGLMFPDFIPPLKLVPDIDRDFLRRDRFPVEKVAGFMWDDWLTEGEVKPETHVEIALIALNQFLEVFQKANVMLTDRREGNIMLDESPVPTSLQFDGKYWKVIQVDLNTIYSLQTGKFMLPNQEKEHFSFNAFAAERKMHDKVDELVRVLTHVFWGKASQRKLIAEFLEKTAEKSFPMTFKFGDVIPIEEKDKILAYPHFVREELLKLKSALTT